MALAQSRRIFRARQRSRTALRAFADPLLPVFEETSIDQLRVKVNGSWRSQDHHLSAADYRELVATCDLGPDWVRQPDNKSNLLLIQTRQSPPSTLGFRLTVRDLGTAGAAIAIEFRCNPTRTLAHLLARHGTNDDFAGHLTRLPAREFFSSAPDVPKSLDGNDNWIADVDGAARIFGRDVFSGFLPIYVLQLRALSLLLTSHNPSGAVHEDGGSDTLTTPEGILRLDWHLAKAPQMETFFERHHGSARAVVRSAAQNVLTSLDYATVRHHLSGAGFEREGDLFSMRCDLPYGRTLSAYAKAPSRLRFEISRKKAGRYLDPVQPGASGRLLSIFSSERNALLSACQWRVVGELFAEHGVPIPHDMLWLIGSIQRCCAGLDQDFPSVLEAMLVDGGMSMTTESSAIVRALVTEGVLTRTTLRRRNGSLPHRYALSPRYMPVHLALLDALSGSDT